jgi:Fur family ferric uptake transcriptional regulator
VGTALERDLVDLLRARGFRATPQRQLILDAILASRGHATFDEIYARVRAAAPTVNRATIYRNLDFLRSQRLIVTAEINGRTVYELGAEPHHHFVCHTCRTVTELPHRLVRDFFRRIERELAFSVEMDHLVLSGTCPLCRSGGRPTNGDSNP